MVDHDELCDATTAVRHQAWKRFGELDPYVLAPIVNPSFAGGPVWPNLRQAYQVVYGQLGTLIATDGLADPFDDSWTDPPQQNGFALEAYAIADQLPGQDVRNSWLFPLVMQFAQLVAQNGNVHELIDEFGTISTELWDVPIPAEFKAKFVNEEGRVGVLVGMDVLPGIASIDGPIGPIRLANLKLLTLAELKWIVERGDSGREHVTRELLSTASPLVSSLSRESVV
jgi:hypothetical protein